MPFLLYPAVDLRAGRCVRLRQGDFAAETAYDEDAVRVASEFAAAGVEWLHVVDLDAARTGEPYNLEVIRAICAAVPCRVQAGGGVRSFEAGEALFRAGAARVVVGTAAVERPQLVEDLAALHPGGVAVGLDARGRDIAVRGWVEVARADLLELARRLGAGGAAALVVTSIGRDGTLEGPDLEQLTAVLDATALPVIASGGVGSLDDLGALAQLAARGRGLAGAIVGTALYERRFTLREALDRVA